MNENERSCSVVFTQTNMVVKFLTFLLSVCFIYLFVNFDQIFLNESEDVNIETQLKVHQPYLLHIGIISAPQNTDRRQSIRETWLNYVENDIGYSFIIGARICHIPTKDRIEPGVCELLEYNGLNLSELNKEYKSHHHTDSEEIKKTEIAGFGFKTRHRIKITKLGILNSVLKNNANVTVFLVSSNNKEILTAITLNKEKKECDNPGYKYQEINPIVVPPAFELRLHVEPVSVIHDKPSCEKQDWSEDNILHFVEIIEAKNMRLAPFSNKLCSPVAAAYVLPDTEEIKSHILQKEERLRAYSADIKTMEENLFLEEMKYHDIKYLDLVDVYSNLPMKVVEFYKWTKELDVEFVLKTDDDVFVDLHRVRRELLIVKQHDEIRPKYWWWSYFREYWKVQKIGKWKDLNYLSVTYPPFPCGGAYMLNKNIINYITSMADDLKLFQGEDVSMGIWLSGLNVHVHTTEHDSDIKIDDKMDYCPSFFEVNESCTWTCDKICPHDYPCCNLVDLTLPQMYRIWNMYIQTGQITNKSFLPK